MSGPNPYAPMQWPEQQQLLYGGALLSQSFPNTFAIENRTPTNFASATNKDSVAFSMGSILALVSGGVKLANAGSSSTQAIGIACLGAPAGQPEVMQFLGLFTLSDWTPITGTASLTPLASYYLSTTSGKLTTTAPSSPNISQFVGIATTAQTLNLAIAQPAAAASGGVSALGGVNMLLKWSTATTSPPGSGQVRLDPTLVFPGAPGYIFSSTDRNGVNLNSTLQTDMVNSSKKLWCQIQKEGDQKCWIIIGNGTMGFIAGVFSSVSFTTEATGGNWPPADGDNVTVSFFMV